MNRKPIIGVGTLSMARLLIAMSRHGSGRCRNSSSATNATALRRILINVTTPYKDLFASGPRLPRPGVPHTFVTTETFLVTFDLQSLRDLPELELSHT